MKLIVAAFSLVVLSAIDSSAQGINDPIDDLRNPANALKRAMERRRLMNYAGIAEMENDRMRAAGQARIDAGQATTTFQRINGTIAPAQWGAKAPNPGDRQAWTEQYNQGLAIFESLAEAYQINRNDVAEGIGLAFALAYEIYSGRQSATNDQRKAFAEATRQNLLHNPVFQSYSDRDRQVIYERNGMNVGLAAAKSAAASQSRNDALRNEAIVVARDTLAGLWPYPVEGLELTNNGFEDRGIRLIQEGKATTQFTPPSKPLATDPQQLQLWRSFERVAQGAKVPMNDFAAVMATCVVINWANAMGGQRLDQQRYEWTYAGIKKMVLTNPDWQRMSDIQKESNLEAFAIRAMAVSAEMQEAAKPVAEQLSGGMLAVARSNGIDQASLRVGRMKIVALKALANLDSLLPPKFANYTLTESGFVVASPTGR